MSGHFTEDRLHEWLDDTLSAADRAEVDAHLGRCDECTQRAEGLRTLVGELAALPRGIAPGRDLLPGISARIDDEAPSSAWRTVPLRRAAAILLVAGAAGIAAALLTDGARPPEPAVAVLPEAGAFERTRAGYARATAELETALDAQRDALPPEAVAAVEHSLAAIDAALGEAAAALEKEPDNTLLTELVLDGWERKLDVLRRAAAPTAP